MSLSLSLSFSLLCNLSSLSLFPSFPLNLSIHLAVETFTWSLPSPYWHKSLGTSIQPQINILKTHTYFYTDMRLMMISESKWVINKLMVISRLHPCAYVSFLTKLHMHTHVHAYRHTRTHTHHAEVHAQGNLHVCVFVVAPFDRPPERVQCLQASLQSPVTVGGGNRRRQGGGLWQRHKSTSV